MRFIYHSRMDNKISTGGVRFNMEVLKGLEKISPDIHFLEARRCSGIPIFFYLFENIRLAYRFNRICTRNSLNIVVLDYTNRITHLLVALWSRSKRNCFFVANVAAIYFSYRKNKFKNKLDKTISKIFLSQADIVLCRGTKLREIIIGKWKVVSPKSYVISSAVRKEFQDSWLKADLPKNGVWNLIFVGRMHPIKGLEYLLDALNLLRNYSVKLYVLAELDNSPYCIKILKKIKQDDLGQKIMLTGKVTDVNQLIEFYLASHISLLSSLWDTYPTALMESMCLGLPIIATKVGDVPYIIEDGRTGILVEPGNSTQLANAIRHLITNKDIWVSMSAASFEHSKIFKARSWEDVSIEFNQMILEGVSQYK